MKTDDPKLTAYALGELSTAECAEIEASLRDDTALATEIGATRDFATRLRAELQAEEGARLSVQQHDEVLSLANAQADSAKVIAMAVWPRRLLKIAAALILCAGAAVWWGVTSYQGAKVSIAGSGTQEPRGWDDYSSLRKLSVSVGDKVTGANLEGELRGEVSPYSALAAAAPTPSRELAEIEIDKAGVVTGKELMALTDLGAAQLATPAWKSQPGIIRPHGEPSGAPTSGGVGNGTLFRLERTLEPGSPAISEAVVSQDQLIDAALKSASKFQTASGGPNSTIPVFREIKGPIADTGTITKSSTGSLQPPPSAPVPSKAWVALDSSAAGLPRTLAKREMNDNEAAVGLAPAREGNTESYDPITDNAFLPVKDQPLSTLSIDVDTASYANVRRFLTSGALPPKGAVRIEEMLNYFTYDYPQPAGDAPFSATMDVAACPWTPEHRLVRIGLKGRDLARSERPNANLVFLIDVSGSMNEPNKLPLVKESLRLLVDQLDDRDQVAIAVYAGASGTVLEPTRDKAQMRAALDRLQAGGSTNGAGGIQLAYELAARSFIKGGTNRVILATDGDFNVGITDQGALVELITRKAKSGVFLSVLGYGMGNLKDSTLEKLADKGNGNYGYIDTLAEAKKTLVQQMNGTLYTIAKDVKIQVEFNPAQASAYRLIGYENRLLAKEDFNDDKKDAGEIGAGHMVTALYEVVPVGGAMPAVLPLVDALKYTAESAAKPAAKPEAIVGGKLSGSAEMLTLKLRYKKPDGDISQKLEFPLTDRGETWEKSAQDFRWAAAVASFGMLLRDSPHKGGTTWDATLEMAREGKGDDSTGYRVECLALMERAKSICAGVAR